MNIVNEEVEETNKETVTSTYKERLVQMDLCRVCANVNDQLIPIFEGEGLQHELCDKIHKYLPIRVSEKDILPLQLCYHCAATLLSWHELLEGCVNAERKLMAIQESTQEKEQCITAPLLEPLQTALQEVDPEPNVEEQLLEEQQSVRDGVCKESVANDTDRSSNTWKSFKVFLNMQNMFWKPHKRKKHLQEKGPATDEECIPIWNTEMESLDPLAMDSDEPEQSDAEVSKRASNILKFNQLTKSKSKKYEEKQTLNNSTKKKKLKSQVRSSIKSEKETNNALEEHKNILYTQNIYKCEECGKCFKLKDSYLRHIRIHRDERPFTCHMCGKQFRDSGGLARHVKDVHAKVKNFPCEFCGRCFASKATREDHRRTHTGERPYICDSCGKTFKSKAALYIHSKLHTNEYPHVCTYCNKKFRRRQEMLVHETTHTGEKNFACDICSKRFRVKSELVRHKLVHSDVKPFTCTKCGFSFRQKRYLNNHLKTRHDA